ncbi:MAG TPA: helix-turn-helix transcriptional regulator [Streptosporangiaceae bacterium]|jgi:DNA-binding CsgD family transcriptional regulator
MLAEPALGVAGLGERLTLPESDVRDSLDELVRFSLVRESREDSERLRAVTPDIGLAVILHRQEEDLARRRHELALSRVTIAEALEEYSDLLPGRAADGIEHLVGLDAVQARLEILAAELTSECLSVMPGPQSEASLAASRPLDADALDRGISVLTLYQDSARNDAATYAYARWLTDLGGEVRTAPLLPPRMLIFDRRIALVPIDPENTRAGAICTTEGGIVASMVAIYEQAWEIAVPLGACAVADSLTGLTPEEQEILRMIAMGLTDEAAGRRLGLSERTVRRKISGLMERLGATSRFEAGVKAAQRGWL